ncbi:MAG: hypothetical protein V1928_00665 [Parcubacteria group bacterium]
MKKKIIILIIASAALAAVGLGYRFYENFLIETRIGNYEYCLKLARDFPDRKAEIVAQCEKEASIARQPDDYHNYVNIPLGWKNLGEQTESDVFIKRAIVIYLIAFDKFDAKYLTSWNLAQLYAQLGDLKSAEQYFLAAIENNNLESEPYLATAEFYRYKLKKSAEFLIGFYERALKAVTIDPDVILDDYGRYLCDIGEYASALKQYEKLAARRPGSFSVIISDLKEKIKE